jgi:outer membrane receptor protein involved in Fe transport
MFFQPSDDYGFFTFSPGLFTNSSFGDFLLGLPQQSFFAVTSPQIDARTTQYGVYGQDAWQVNSHLMVSFGLRWEASRGLGRGSLSRPSFSRGTILFADRATLSRCDAVWAAKFETDRISLAAA